MTAPRVVIQKTDSNGSQKRAGHQVRDGSIIVRFEKTPPPIKPTDIVCPHFWELKWATGCPFNCSWCYLKGTLRFLPCKTKPRPKDFAKIEHHVRAFLAGVDGCDGEILNTGELADSLMWEENGNPFSKFILSLFQGQTRHRVLFLTKSVDINNLLNTSFQNQAIMSFSLNATIVASQYEKGAPPVEKRIAAAGRLDEAGYEVRIRIDPMVPVPNWEIHYRNLIDAIFSKFTPERITFGSLRGLQSTINNATDKSWVRYLSEKSNWGKRIAFGVRTEMYYTLISYLNDNYGYGNIGLCKETLEVWHALGMDYKKIRCNCIK